MSIYIDRKYLLLISFSFRNFKTKKDDLFNFSCPYCGDSQRNKLKARGYVYRKGNDYFYICHNCNVSTTFGKLLQHMNPEKHKEYVFERYAQGENKHSNYKKPDIKQMLDGPKPQEKFKHLNQFKDSIKDLPNGHYAKEYIRNRKIPERFWDELFFTDNYKRFLDTNFPNHGKEKLPEDARIVMFYTSSSGFITNVTGRALAADNKIRYITVKVSDEKKVFGLHRLEGSEVGSRVYVVEGQFDSMFIPNAVASGDANLIGLAEYLKKHNSFDVVLVYDNQPRNKDIVRQMKDAIEAGYTVALLPYDPDAKDINEMVRGGMTPQAVKELIDSHSYQGLTAQMKFTEWRKC